VISSFKKDFMLTKKLLVNEKITVLYQRNISPSIIKSTLQITKNELLKTVRLTRFLKIPTANRVTS